MKHYWTLERCNKIFDEQTVKAGNHFYSESKKSPSSDLYLVLCIQQRRSRTSRREKECKRARKRFLSYAPARLLQKAYPSILMQLTRLLRNILTLDPEKPIRPEYLHDIEQFCAECFLAKSFPSDKKTRTRTELYLQEGAEWLYNVMQRSPGGESNTPLPIEELQSVRLNLPAMQQVLLEEACDRFFNIKHFHMLLF